MTKKRILFSGEASWLSTGFATYNKELIRRLHATGKYTIAEVGSFGSSAQEEAKKLPWKFYGVLPLNKNEERIYKSNPTNAFGVYKIDAVLADFQPDIVFDARDPWMVHHIMSSRYKENFKSILVPTVDSAPYKKEWITDTFGKSEIICTYSNYGKRIMEMEKLSVADVLSPGVDLEVFRPMDRNTVRGDWGIKKDINIIGTVMRNQKRKLFPDLFEAFALLRSKYKKVEAVQKSVLLCHTSWPDVGWDIPELLYRSGVQRHVLFTYKCGDCKKIFFTWFLPSDDAGCGRCIFCGKMAAKMPSTVDGVSTSELAEVYNLMDIYIQPAICEGWGLPIVEAKACGVPGLYSNYSAMEDHVENGGGLPIKIGRFYTESETMAVRSLPDIEDMADKMKKLLVDKEMRLRMGKEARECAERMHSWDVSAKKLENIIDVLDIHDRKYTWERRPSIKIATTLRPHPGMSNEQFVTWCYKNILCREPDKKGFHDWIKNLSKGQSRESVEEFFRAEAEAHNEFEEIRWKNSLIMKGVDLNAGITVETDRIPGVLL
jgi:glycosyltransferase involved in cell wall biosynthesis